MVEGIESIGEAVTGGMLARSVEPEAGEGRAHGSNCLNCRTALGGDYCHCCGQKAHVHRTMSAFWHDVAHSVLHFDGKIWRTLPLLAWRPGDLTRRYIDGERARFVSPMALFLFSVFLMFAVFSALGGPLSMDSPIDRTEAGEDIAEERAEAVETLNKLKAERLRLQKTGARTEAVDLSIKGVTRNIAVLDATSRVVASGTQEQVQDAVADDVSYINTEDFDANTGWDRLDKGIEKAAENRSLFFYKIQTNAYKFSWALIPISVPFLWMLFLHRRRYRKDYGAYDHIVFITYSIAFMSLGLIVLTLLRPVGLSQTIVWLAIALVPPVHMYRQLRGAYRLSRRSALWRTFVLLIFAQIAASLFFTMLLTLGALG